jgi:hypothetical protein
MLTNLLIIGSSLGALLFGVFRLMGEYFHTGKDKEETKLSYHVLWKTLDNSKLKNLPEKVVRWFFFLISKPYEIFSDLYESDLVRLLRTTSLSKLVPFLFSGWIVAFLMREYFDLDNRLLIVIYTIYVLLLFIITMFSLIKIMDIFYAKEEKERTLSDEKWKQKKGERWIALVWSSSVFITMTALFLGYKELLDSKDLESAVNFIYFINFIFDTLTIFLSVYILTKILETEHTFTHLCLIFLDLIVAAIFALLTLLLTNFFTDINIPLNEMFWTLFGISPDGNQWEIGKWFWLMHTAFIPTLIFLAVLFFAVLCKLIVIPIAKVFGKASIHDKPHYLTATLFGVIGGVCGFVLVVIKLF